MDENLLLEISENETLHWSYRDYTEFPKELETGNQVEDLYMKQNKINKIPTWINKMVNLCILQLHGNKIKEIPEEIGLLKNLSRLDLGCNAISYLPDSIKYLHKLQELNLENNTLIKLPIEIGFLKTLRVLIMQNNKLIEIPKTIGCCLNLEELHLQNNNITKLPNNIVFLPNLTKLIVEGNNLLYFPSIDFCNQPYIGYAKNKSLNYLSHDFYLYLLDKLQFQRYYRINLVCENIISNEQFYDKLPNIMIELVYCGKKTIIILPEMLEKVFSDTEITNNYIPSLRETLLHKIYDNTLSDNKTMYYYKMNDNILPKQIKDLFLNGPTARCNYCRRFIFTECIIWILQRLIHCSVCVEEDILIVVYFCSKKCSELFKNEEISCTDEFNKLSPMKINWTRIK